MGSGVSFSCTGWCWVTFHRICQYMPLTLSPIYQEASVPESSKKKGGDFKLFPRMARDELFPLRSII